MNRTTRSRPTVPFSPSDEIPALSEVQAVGCRVDRGGSRSLAHQATEAHGRDQCRRRPVGAVEIASGGVTGAQAGRFPRLPRASSRSRRLRALPGTAHDRGAVRSCPHEMWQSSFSRRVRRVAQCREYAARGEDSSRGRSRRQGRNRRRPRRRHAERGSDLKRKSPADLGLLVASLPTIEVERVPRAVFRRRGWSASQRARKPRLASRRRVTVPHLVLALAHAQARPSPRRLDRVRVDRPRGNGGPSLQAHLVLLPGFSPPGEGIGGIGCDVAGD